MTILRRFMYQLNRASAFGGDCLDRRAKEKIFKKIRQTEFRLTLRDISADVSCKISHAKYRFMIRRMYSTCTERCKIVVSIQILIEGEEEAVHCSGARKKFSIIFRQRPLLPLVIFHDRSNAGILSITFADSRTGCCSIFPTV